MCVCKSLLLIFISFGAGAKRLIASLSFQLIQEVFFQPKAMLISI